MMLPKMEGMKMSNEEKKISKALAKRRYAEVTDKKQKGLLLDEFCAAWGEGAQWTTQNDVGPHEANFLKLDCAKIKTVLGWRPKWNIKIAVAKTVDWIKAWRSAPSSVPVVMERQIGELFTW